jgi:DNA polymerase/3'-5' exonuclease PolX
MGVAKTDSVARRIDIHKMDYDEWGSGVLYFTGSKEFNITMRNRAISKGYKLSEKGLFYKNGERVPNTRTEKEIFEVLDMPYVPPEDR